MTDLTPFQIERCRATMPAFARAHDAAQAVMASTAESRERYGDGLELQRKRRELQWMRAKQQAALAAPIRWKQGSP